MKEFCVTQVVRDRVVCEEVDAEADAGGSAQQAQQENKNPTQ